jgi:thioredoxin reductase
VQDRRWGYLARAKDTQFLLHFALLARGWTRDLVVFTSGEVELAAEARDKLQRAGIRLEETPISRLVVHEQQLEAVELSDGSRVPRDVLFSHPPQRQVELVRTLGVELDDDGFVRVDAMTRETSVSGIYAAGDLTTRLQGAIWAAAAGAQAAAAINGDLTAELALTGDV